MTRQVESVAVQVPASSANLGPGYDAFAVALDVHLVAWTVEPGEGRVQPEGEGADELPTDERNLVWRAFVAYCEWAGVPTPEVSLRTRNPIPLERGMGSSSAAAVAGVALGRAVTGAGGSDRDLVALAAAFEGHADNAAAAVLGGLCVVVDGHPRRLEPSDALRPVLCVPRVRQSTDEARGLLPTSLPVAQAAANAARAAVTLAGLCGATAFDPAAMTDVLHEPARLAAMPGSGALVASLRADGIGACLSGAGPTVLAVVPAGDSGAVEAVRRRAGSEFEVLDVRWDRAGAALCPPSAVAARR
jgi:homoserine kinase